jgi:hypothetical protein
MNIEVKVKDGTIYLTLTQIAQLFGRDKSVISRHLSSIYREGELSRTSTVAKNATVQTESGRRVKRTIEFYNLDAIISVGYRVNSKQGTQFRIWATNVLRDYLVKGIVTNQRIERIENNYEELSKEVKSITQKLQASGLPKQGIFFEGQIFDAYIFVVDLIKRAKTEIVLIDNYLDETVLTLMTKRKPGVRVVLFTRSMSSSLRLDIEKHNRQYPPIAVQTLTESHDRFLIIDRTELYHVGASLKDVGKKWFAFSKLDLPAELILSRLPNV